MKKLAFIDLDGTVCNSTKRFDQALQNGKINWEIAFTASLLALDELIGQAEERITELADDGWEIIYLSSRPEKLRRATRAWLKVHGLDGHELILKPAKFRMVSTPKWKAEIICKRASDAQEVLFVDDEAENMKAVKEIWRQKVGYSGLKVLKSLDLIRE